MQGKGIRIRIVLSCCIISERLWQMKSLKINPESPAYPEMWSRNVFHSIYALLSSQSTQFLDGIRIGHQIKSLTLSLRYSLCLSFEDDEEQQLSSTAISILNLLDNPLIFTDAVHSFFLCTVGFGVL